MAVTSRAELTEYCLRNLGEPVVEINVDDVQLEERIDEALDYWNQYHFDGAEKLYLRQKITATRITLGVPPIGPPFTNDAAQYKFNEKITGLTSGATAKVCKEHDLESSGTTLLVRDVEGTFVAGETIRGEHDYLGGGPITSILYSIELGTYDKRYIPLPDNVYGVTRVIPFNVAGSSKNLFDLQYQLRLNDLYDLTSTSIIYYKTVMSHIALLNLELNGYPLYRFNRMQGNLYLDVNWQTAFAIGDYILVEAYRALNPAEWTKVWNEPWLRKYVTALFKRQWATNIKKFQGIQLPGGVTIDGASLYMEAMNEIKALEDEMLNKAAPLEFFLG
jgi:hypothetical protein